MGVAFTVCVALVAWKEAWCVVDVVVDGKLDANAGYNLLVWHVGVCFALTRSPGYANG